MTEIDLLPCPFCGSAGTFEHDGEITAAASCSSAHCALCFVDMRPVEWNTRADTAEVAKLRQQRGELVAALKKYASHTGGERLCASAIDSNNACDCGLNEIIANATKGASP